MSKELEALYTIKKLTLNIDNFYKEELDIIEKGLERLESIDNAKPDEALACLDKLEECADGMKDLPKSNWIDLAETEAELDYKIMEWVETIKFELFKGKQALIKAQEQEEENGRAFGKDIINLNKTLKQVIDKPILYASRYGNKYIVPQELFEEQGKVLENYKKALEIIKKKDVNVWYLTVSTKVKTYKDYNSFLMNDKGKRQLTEEEFELLKEVFSNKLKDNENEK